MVKDFGGVVHLTDDDHHFIVNVLLVGFQVEADLGLQGTVHLYQQRKEQVIRTDIVFLILDL